MPMEAEARCAETESAVSENMYMTQATQKAAEVGRLVAELADYIAADEAFSAFVIFGDDSVISYKGEGLGNYLAVVAWVGEGFEVAGHSCGKNCFADCGASCSD